MTPPPIRRGERPAGLDRRTVLKGLLGGAAVTVALPVLEVHLRSDGRAFADGGVLPRRYVQWTWGNGIVPSRWIPVDEGAAWTLSETLSPLAPVKDVISLVTGLEVRVPNVIPHYSGPAGFLSGHLPLGEEGDNTFAKPSLDQVLAAEIGGLTRFRSLEIGCEPGMTGISYNGPNSMNPPETSPQALFDRLFGAGFTAPGEEVVVDPRLRLRRSVLDAVMGQASALQARVSAADRLRIDQHLSGIRDLETRLRRMEEDPPNLAACARPATPDPAAELALLSDRHRVLADLAAMALACDQTRVLSCAATDPVSNWLFPGISAGYHQLTHDEPEDQVEVSACLLQLMDELRYFIEALRAVPEGDGTLLDNCALLATSEVSFGRNHALDEWPVITAGRACGYLNQGLHYRSANRENASLVIVTLLRALGVTSTAWGEGDTFSDDGLSALEA